MEFQCELMCRLCLRENDNFFSIFEVNKIYGYIPAIVISLLLDSQVSETDGYPQDVCLTCLNKLTEYKSFKEQCHSAKSRFDRNYGRKCNSSSIVPEAEVRIVIKEESEGSESSEEPGVEIKEETEESESSEEILPAVKQETLTHEDEIVLNEQEILPQIKQEFSSSVERNVENEQEDVLEIMQESSEIEEENDLFDQTEEESFSISDMDDQNLSNGTPDVLKTKRGKEKLLEYVCKERKNIRRTKMQWKSESRESKEQQHRQSSNGQNCTLKKTIKQHPRAPWFVKPEPKKMLDKIKVLAESTDLSIEDIISSVLPNLEMNEKYRLRLVSWLSQSIKNWREADNFNRVTQVNRQGGLY